MCARWQLFGADLLQGLLHVHSHGFLLSDFTLQHILVDEYGVLKLANFRHSRRIPTLVEQTNSLQARGPLHSTPPELVLESWPGGPSAVPSRAADLWAVGCFLLQLALGHPPFEDVSSGEELLERHRGPLPIPRVAQGTGASGHGRNDPPFGAVSPAFNDLLRRLLARHPRLRIGWSELLRHEFFHGCDLPEEPPPLREEPLHEAFLAHLDACDPDRDEIPDSWQWLVRAGDRDSSPLNAPGGSSGQWPAPSSSVWKGPATSLASGSARGDLDMTAEVSDSSALYATASQLEESLAGTVTTDGIPERRTSLQSAQQRWNEPQAKGKDREETAREATPQPERNGFGGPQVGSRPATASTGAPREVSPPHTAMSAIRSQTPLMASRAAERERAETPSSSLSAMGSRKSGRSLLSWDACEEVARATAVELVRDPRVWNVNRGRARLRLSNAWIRGATLSRLDGTVRPVIRGIRRGVSGGWSPEEHTKLLESARLAPMSVVELSSLYSDAMDEHLAAMFDALASSSSQVPPEVKVALLAYSASWWESVPDPLHMDDCNDLPHERSTAVRDIRSPGNVTAPATNASAVEAASLVAEAILQSTLASLWVRLGCRSRSASVRKEAWMALGSALRFAPETPLDVLSPQTLDYLLTSWRDDSDVLVRRASLAVLGEALFLRATMEESANDSTNTDRVGPWIAPLVDWLADAVEASAQSYDHGTPHQAASDPWCSVLVARTLENILAHGVDSAIPAALQPHLTRTLLHCATQHAHTTARAAAWMALRHATIGAWPLEWISSACDDGGAEHWWEAAARIRFLAAASASWLSQDKAFPEDARPHALEVVQFARDRLHQGLQRVEEPSTALSGSSSAGNWLHAVATVAKAAGVMASWLTLCPSLVQHRFVDVGHQNVLAKDTQLGWPLLWTLAWHGVRKASRSSFLRPHANASGVEDPVGTAAAVAVGSAALSVRAGIVATVGGIVRSEAFAMGGRLCTEIPTWGALLVLCDVPAGKDPPSTTHWIRLVSQAVARGAKGNATEAWGQTHRWLARYFAEVIGPTESGTLRDSVWNQGICPAWRDALPDWLPAVTEMWRQYGMPRSIAHVDSLLSSTDVFAKLLPLESVEQDGTSQELELSSLTLGVQHWMEHDWLPTAVRLLEACAGQSPHNGTLWWGGDREDDSLVAHPQHSSVVCWAWLAWGLRWLAPRQLGSRGLPAALAPTLAVVSTHTRRITAASVAALSWRVERGENSARISNGWDHGRFVSGLVIWLHRWSELGGVDTPTSILDPRLRLARRLIAALPATACPPESPEHDEHLSRRASRALLDLLADVLFEASAETSGRAAPSPARAAARSPSSPKSLHHSAVVVAEVTGSLLWWCREGESTETATSRRTRQEETSAAGTLSPGVPSDWPGLEAAWSWMEGHPLRPSTATEVAEAAVRLLLLLERTFPAEVGRAMVASSQLCQDLVEGVGGHSARSLVPPSGSLLPLWSTAASEAASPGVRMRLLRFLRAVLRGPAQDTVRQAVEDTAGVIAQLEGWAGDSLRGAASPSRPGSVHSRATPGGMAAAVLDALWQSHG